MLFTKCLLVTDWKNSSSVHYTQYIYILINEFIFLFYKDWLQVAPSITLLVEEWWGSCLQDINRKLI